MLLKELEIREAVFEFHFTGPDRTHRGVKKGPQDGCGALVALLRPLMSSQSS